MGKYGRKLKAKEERERREMEEEDKKAVVEAEQSAHELPESAMGKKFSHPDKKVRDKAVMVFSHWIAKQDKLDESEHLKVWKALFYCYWMSDKVPIQQ